MDKNLATETINDKMLKVREHINALKFTTNAIPAGDSVPTQADMIRIRSLLSVVTESLDSAVDVACDDMAEYFQSWGN